MDFAIIFSQVLIPMFGNPIGLLALVCFLLLLAD